MNKIKVSVVLATFNGTELLKRAIHSILKSTHKNFELIIVDDDSKHLTKEILAKFASSDNRIKIVENSENLGLAEALNRGWRKAQSEFIFRMDDDDIAHPDRIRSQLIHLMENPDIGVLGSAVYLLGPDGENAGERIPPTDDIDIKNALLKTTCLVHPTVVIRKHLLEQFQGYRKNLSGAEDLDLWLRIKSSTRFANLPNKLLTYQLNNNFRARRRAVVARVILSYYFGIGRPFTGIYYLLRGMAYTFLYMFHLKRPGIR